MDQEHQLEDPEFKEQYHRIRADLRKVVLTNLAILTLLILVYFINRQTGFADRIINIL